MKIETCRMYFTEGWYDISTYPDGTIIHYKTKCLSFEWLDELMQEINTCKCKNCSHDVMWYTGQGGHYIHVFNLGDGAYTSAYRCENISEHKPCKCDKPEKIEDENAN